jgi:uncharacterized membrane protein
LTCQVINVPKRPHRPNIAAHSRSVPQYPDRLQQVTKENVRAVAELEKSASANRNNADFFADAITRFVGSMLFVYLHLLWFGVWIGFNSLSAVPQTWHFDPYPFTFLTFVVSLEAIFLSTFILISQNHEERLARRRNQLDLQINLLAEQETTKIIQMLEVLHEHFGLEVDPEIKQFETKISPGDIVREIESRLEQCGDRKNGESP